MLLEIVWVLCFRMGWSHSSIIVSSPYNVILYSVYIYIYESCKHCVTRCNSLCSCFLYLSYLFAYCNLKCVYVMRLCFLGLGHIGGYFQRFHHNKHCFWNSPYGILKSTSSFHNKISAFGFPLRNALKTRLVDIFILDCFY